MTLISKCNFFVSQSKAAKCPLLLPNNKCRPFLEYLALYGPKSKLSSNIFEAAVMSTFSAIIFCDMAVVLQSSSTSKDL